MWIFHPSILFCCLLHHGMLEFISAASWWQRDTPSFPAGEINCVPLAHARAHEQLEVVHWLQVRIEFWPSCCEATAPTAPPTRNLKVPTLNLPKSFRVTASSQSFFSSFKNEGKFYRKTWKGLKHFCLWQLWKRPLLCSHKLKWPEIHHFLSAAILKICLPTVCLGSLHVSGAAH